jgi:imidazolonepropionase-like amidohydrolase
LDNGFTTIRDLGAFPGFPDVALMRAIEAGHILGPDIWPAGHAISITGGHCDSTGFAPGIMAGIADGVTEAMNAVRCQAKHGVRVIKVFATAGVFSFSQNAQVGAQQYSSAELEAIVNEARRLGLKVAAHAHGTEGINAAILVGMGISPIDTLRMATVNAAELLDVDDRGQLKVGMRADIIAVSKNPLEDITAMEAVSFVMKQGEIFKR